MLKPGQYVVCKFSSLCASHKSALLNLLKIVDKEANIKNVETS